MVLSGATLAGAHMLIPSATVSDALYLASTVFFGVALLASATIHKPDRRIWPVVLVVALCSVAGQVAGNNTAPNESMRAVSELLFFATQLALVIGLLVVVNRRGTHEVSSVLGDSVIVAIGVWLTVWISLLQPSLDITGETTTVTIIRGVTTGASAVVVLLLAYLLFADAVRTPAVTLLSAAIGFSLMGDLLYAIDTSGHVEIAQHFAYAPYVMCYFVGAAAFMHPSISQLTDHGTIRNSHNLLGRLVVTTSALVVPVIFLSVTNPESTADRVVRTISIAVLATAVMFRVVQAVRSNAASQAALVRTAKTDALTGLPNRPLVIEYLAEALQSAWKSSRRPTVLFIDVDRFKAINDSLGHATGDDVLMSVASRLSNAVPDRAIVGRIAGDEFVVLDPGTHSVADAMMLADHVLNAFKEPLAVDQGDVFVSASIGVAVASKGQMITPDELLRNADTAMYRAKHAGRNCVALFDESMLERVTQRLAVETALYRALEREELELFHQPIIDITLGDVVGFEALMRWEREDGTMVSPAEFIPIAEETGTIVPIGAWALLEALSHLRGWIDEGVCSKDATMSVNVSPKQLHDPNFFAIVNEALMRSRVRADQLWLEVTESVMITEPEIALASLTKLSEIGVRVAIDDFGTGYSSLSLLQKFPIHRIKIDRSFVSGVADDSSARSLARTILAMSSSLGMDTVAEGVESLRQLQTLSALGCAKAQGFLISHPVPVHAMRATITALNDISNWPQIRR